MSKHWFYTNAFAVKSYEDFESFCQLHDLELFKENGLVGCFRRDVGIAEVLDDTHNGIVFLRMIGGHLQDGHVAVVADVRVAVWSHGDCAWQVMYAVNTLGFIYSVDPAEIFSRALHLGSHVGHIQDMSVFQGESHAAASHASTPSKMSLWWRWRVLHSFLLAVKRLERVIGAKGKTAQIEKQSWTVSLRDDSHQSFFVVAPARAVAKHISIETLPEGWSCGGADGWVYLLVPAGDMNTALRLQELLECAPEYRITNDAKNLLDDLTNLPGWCEIF